MHDLSFLLVEDHAFQRALIERMLQNLGVGEVAVAANGKEALRLLRERRSRFDIVLTDLMMPEVDGIELIPELKLASPGVALVLASVDPSSLAMAATIARGHGVPVLGTIHKPITPDKLLPLIEAWRASR
jgi:CheY-like chemotaxis protein